MSMSERLGAAASSARSNVRGKGTQEIVAASGEFTMAPVTC